jgi:hypothetical protein
MTCSVDRPPVGWSPARGGRRPYVLDQARDLAQPPGVHRALAAGELPDRPDPCGPPRSSAFAVGVVAGVLIHTAFYE